MSHYAIHQPAFSLHDSQQRQGAVPVAKIGSDIRAYTVILRR